jgi:hypothetical protein
MSRDSKKPRSRSLAAMIQSMRHRILPISAGNIAVDAVMRRLPVA